MIIPGNAAPIPCSQHDPLKPPSKSPFFLVPGFTQSIPWGFPLHSSAGSMHCRNSGASEQQMAPLGFLEFYVIIIRGEKEDVKVCFSQKVPDCWIWGGRTLVSNETEEGSGWGEECVIFLLFDSLTQCWDAGSYTGCGFPFLPLSLPESPQP